MALSCQWLLCSIATDNELAQHHSRPLAAIPSAALRLPYSGHSSFVLHDSVGAGGCSISGATIEQGAQISLRPLFSTKPMPTVLELHLSPETKPIALIVTLTDAIVERLRIEGHTVWPRVGCAKRDLRSEAIGCGGH